MIPPTGLQFLFVVPPTIPPEDNNSSKRANLIPFHVKLATHAIRIPQTPRWCWRNGGVGRRNAGSAVWWCDVCDPKPGGILTSSQDGVFMKMYLPIRTYSLLIDLSFMVL